MKKPKIYQQVRIPSKIVKVQLEPVHTRYLQIESGPKKGLMDGRKSPVPKRDSDMTKIRRIVKDYDVNKDNKIDDRDYRAGQIIGRAPAEAPLGTIKKPRYITVNRYIRRNGPVRAYRKYIK